MSAQIGVPSARRSRNRNGLAFGSLLTANARLAASMSSGKDEIKARHARYLVEINSKKVRDVGASEQNPALQVEHDRTFITKWHFNETGSLGTKGNFDRNINQLVECWQASRGSDRVAPFTGRDNTRVK